MSKRHGFFKDLLRGLLGIVVAVAFAAMWLKFIYPELNSIYFYASAAVVLLGVIFGVIIPSVRMRKMSRRR